MAKKFTFCLICLLLVLPLSAFAQRGKKLGQSNTVPETRQSLQEYRQEQNQERKQERLRELGQEMIQKRIRDMERVQTRLESAQRISEAVKTELQNQIQENITELQALETEIEGIEDFQTLQGKVRSIITEYHIYLVFIPKIRGLALVDRLRYFIEKVEDVKEEIEEKAKDLEGEDKEKVEGFIDLAEDYIGGASDSATEAEDKFKSMKLGDVETAVSLKVAGHKAIIAGRESLRSAMQYLRQAARIIRGSEE